MAHRDEIEMAAQYMVDTASDVKNPEGLKQYWIREFSRDLAGLRDALRKMHGEQAREEHTVQRAAEDRAIKQRRLAARIYHRRNCECRRDHGEPCKAWTRGPRRSIVEIFEQAKQETPERISNLKAREFVSAPISYGSLSERHADSLFDLDDWQPGLVDKLERDAEAIVYEGMRRYLYVSNGKLASWRTNNSIVKDRVFAEFERLVNQAVKDKNGG